ncbi:O-antigen ligase family protein [Flavobacterium sp.]
MSAKWIEKLYFGFLLLLPLVFCTTIVDSVLLPRQILLSGFLLVAVALLIVTKTTLAFNFKNPVFYAMGAFLALNAISLLHSGIPGEAHAVFSRLILLYSFFLLTCILLYNGVIKVNQLAMAAIVFGLIALSFPIISLYGKTLKGGHLLKDVNLITGNSANKNLLSSILFLCLPFYCIGLQIGKITKYIAAFTILSTIGILMVIRTRAVLIALMVFGALLILYFIKQKFSIRKRYIVGSGIALALLAVFSYSMYFKEKAVSTNSKDVAQHYFSRLLDSKTLDSRMLFWKNSIHVWQESPLFGVGLGNWQILFPKFGLNNFTEYAIVNGESTLQRPHNDFIWILCETGIFGLLAYLAIFGFVLYQLCLLIKNSETAKEKWKFLFIFSAIVGYLVISFFDFPYERIEHQVIIMLFFAIATAACSKRVSSPDKSFGSLVITLLVPIGYSLLVSFYRLDGEQHAAKMYLAKANANWTETIYESKKANNYFYPLDNTSMPLTWYEGIGHFNENRPEESQECFEKAYRLTPYNIQVITNLASTYQVNGKSEEAVALYKEALGISKNFDEAKLNLAALYFNRKEYAKAYLTINEVKVGSKNPKYQTYLVPILNQKINDYLKTATNKEVVANLVKNVTTKEALLKLFFDAKKNNIPFEAYLAQAKF